MTQPFEKGEATPVARGNAAESTIDIHQIFDLKGGTSGPLKIDLESNVSERQAGNGSGLSVSSAERVHVTENGKPVPMHAFNDLTLTENGHDMRLSERGLVIGNLGAGGAGKDAGAHGEAGKDAGAHGATAKNATAPGGPGRDTAAHGGAGKDAGAHGGGPDSDVFKKVLNDQEGHLALATQGSTEEPVGKADAKPNPAANDLPNLTIEHKVRD